MEGSTSLPTRGYLSQSVWLWLFHLDRKEPASSFNPTWVCVCVCVCVCVLFLLCSAQADTPLMSDDWAPLHSSCYGYQPGSVHTDTHRNFDLQWSLDGRARVPQNHPPTLTHTHTHIHTHNHTQIHKPSCMYAKCGEMLAHMHPQMYTFHPHEEILIHLHGALISTYCAAYH